MQSRSWLVGLAALAGVCLLVPLAGADNVEGPWGAYNGNIYGWARSPAIPVYFDATSGIQQAWRLDLDTIGAPWLPTFRCPGRAPIVFDKDGNLYFRTGAAPSNGTGNNVVSVAPNGTVRWFAHDALNAIFTFGNPGTWFAQAPIVGDGAFVYAFSGNAGPTVNQAMLAKIRKDNGLVVNTLLLNNEVVSSYGNQNLKVPVLYNSKLYVVSEGNGTLAPVYQVDTGTFTIDWSVQLPILNQDSGAPTLVPDVFGPGQHGLYFNVDGGDADPPELSNPEVYAVNLGTHALAWTAQGGKVARSHVLYNPYIANLAHPKGLLYTATWTDYGAEMYVYDPVTGAKVENQSVPNDGHGFYDVTSLDFDNRTIVAGGFNGNIDTYTDDGTGSTTADWYPYASWFGEPRVFGSLLQSCSAENVPGHTVLVTGTNSRTDLPPPPATHTARAVVLDLDTATPGGTDDGPLYVDNIRVYEGTDYNNAIGNGPVFTENFQTGYPTVPGRVDQNSLWTDTSGSAGGYAAVVNDPTGGSQGVVMKLDPFGNQFLPTQDQGARLTMPVTVPTGMNSFVVVRWLQWRQDLTDNVNINPEDQQGTFQWDSDGKIHTEPNWLCNVPLTTGVWQEVELRYDYYDFILGVFEIYVDGNSDAPDTLDDPTLFVSKIWFNMSPTPPVTPAVINTPTQEYDTGINANHGYTTRGGALVGPDGKIYYFHAIDNDLVALAPVTPAQWSLKADSNCDGQVNAFDIDPFVIALTNRPLWEATYSCGYFCANDINRDGSVNAFDIDPFVLCLTIGCP